MCLMVLEDEEGLLVDVLMLLLVVCLDDDCLVYELGWVYLEEEGVEKDEESDVNREDVGEESSLLELLLELLLVIAEVVEVLEEALVLLLEEVVLNLILFLGNGNVFHSDFQPSSPGCKRKH